MAALFRFGLIADTQYADAEDGYNFNKTRTRRYRHSLEILKRAVEWWNLMEGGGKSLSFILQLGDLIDGQCATLGQKEAAVQTIKACIQKSTCPSWHFCIGNHEMYNYSIKDWVEKMFPSDKGCSYYDFSPVEGWRVIILNCFEICVMQPKDSEEYKLAAEILRENNPNDVLKEGVPWLAGVTGEARRFVPYNGAFSEKQLKWFAKVVSTAAQNGERVLVACHQPIYIPCTEGTGTLPYNFQKALNIVHSHPGTVVAWIAGHDHDGGYACDEFGVHHLVPAAPLECEEGEDSFGVLEVFHEDEFIRVDWKGKYPMSGTFMPEWLAVPAIISNV